MKDPVCNMNVTEDSDHHIQYESKEYYFCSEKCLNKFKQSPLQYEKKECCGHCDSDEKEDKPMNQVGSEDVIYTCPMHLEIEQVGPSNCPKCGMALEPRDIPIIQTKTQYTCPMHPEIIQYEPGNCPICGWH